MAPLRPVLDDNLGDVRLVDAVGLVALAGRAGPAHAAQLKLHESGTSVKFTAAGAELFALKKGRPVPAKFAAAIPTRNESTPNGVESSGVH